MTLAPRPVTARYTVIVSDISNLSSAAQMSMALTGLAPGYIFATDSLVNIPATIPGPLAPSGADSASGTLLTFGRAPSAAANTLALYFWLRDGTNKLFEIPVRSQIDAAADPLNVTIRVSGVALPAVGASGGTGSGMDVGVDNWEIIDIDLRN